MAKYQSGEKPELGDVVECVDSPGYGAAIKDGEQYITLPSPDNFLHVGRSMDLQGWAACRFRLVSRAKRDE